MSSRTHTANSSVNELETAYLLRTFWVNCTHHGIWDGPVDKESRCKWSQFGPSYVRNIPQITGPSTWLASSVRKSTSAFLTDVEGNPQGAGGGRYTIPDVSFRQALPQLLTWSFLWSNDFPLVFRTLNSSIWRKTSRGAATNLLVIILTWWLLLQNQKAATET